ncbi:hypothetical protein Lqui_2350 [Legionella quinlivanii]|uniref:DUF4760 domain-containing protein n=1 Tax=Legionella quinlivanii TaxID=45073 RepID=A0A0W0XSQ6_9GAMM|nr:hypothetical protein [Legionella quinlivanii]KTD47424.1 hypothetical protein Lqui_2350 [Legionella quinlivanii]SEG37984.1 hypothetical protein SAMN02746093_02723 [Legionella quinlivanii DSM 21216]STY10017.1 Uncharacterised protein [Legionella quinlivanii]
MSNFLIGLFTLTGTLSGIWLKDYLEHKTSRLNSLKQKAIATYILCNHLRKALIVQQIVCKGIIEDPNYNYAQLKQDRPDTVLEDLEKMEILIVENFSNLYEDFLQFNSMIISHYRYLLRIMSNKQQISVNTDELKTEIDSYESQMTRLTNNLNQKLKEQFINRPDIYPNFYRYKAAVISFWQNFFKKDFN